MKVLVVEAGRQPMVKEIDGFLRSMQEMVEGYIQPVYPWREEVALVCNEEGKINGLTLNRPLLDVGASWWISSQARFSSARLRSTVNRSRASTDEQIKRYSRLFSLK